MICKLCEERETENELCCDCDLAVEAMDRLIDIDEVGGMTKHEMMRMVRRRIQYFCGATVSYQAVAGIMRLCVEAHIDGRNRKM